VRVQPAPREGAIMFGVSSPEDFLAQCYQIADLVVVIGQFIGQILAVFGVDVPDVREICFDIYDFISF
jgi:hypothetical protein